MARLTAKAWFALSAVYVIWGSTYLAIRVSIETFPPLVMSSTRFVSAGGLMVLVLWAKREGKVTKAQLINAGVAGAALCLGGNGLVSIAEARVASGTAALLIATVPLWMAVIGRMLGDQPLSALAKVGIVIGFLGTAALVRPGGTSDAIGALQVSLAALLWASGSMYARKTATIKPVGLYVGLQMLIGGAVTAFAATITGEWSRFEPGAISFASLSAWLYLIVFGSIVGFSAYAYLLRNVNTTITSTYAYVNPVIAIILGVVIVDERISAATLLAGLVVVASVAAVIWGSRTPLVTLPQERPDESPA